MKKITSIFMLCFLVALNAISQDKKDEFPKTSFSGLIFGDYYYNASRDTAFNPINGANAMTGNNAAFGKANENSVQIRRILFAVEHKATKNVEMLFRLESDPTTATTGNSRYSPFVKDAYAKWNYFQGHNIQFGMFSTGSWDVSEYFWGHRFIEKTITDLRKTTSARDMGIGLNGKLDSLGQFKYSVMFGEGTGVDIFNADWYKRYYGTFTYSPILEFNDKKELVKEMSINLFADFKESKSISNHHYSIDSSRGHNLNGNIMNFTLVAGYKEKGKYAFGIECYFNQAKNAYDNKYETDPLNYRDVNKNGYGISIFGSYSFTEKCEAFGRYDYFEPNSHASDGSKGDTRNFIVLGASYSPAKNMFLSPNVLIETYEKKTITKPDLTKYDLAFTSSITPRLTFYYMFK